MFVCMTHFQSPSQIWTKISKKVSKEENQMGEIDTTLIKILFFKSHFRKYAQIYMRIMFYWSEILLFKYRLYSYKMPSKHCF